MMHNETFVAGTVSAGLPSGETALRLRLINLVRRRRVLDMACANGRWTGVASRSADSIVATDPWQDQLALARRRPYDCRVSFAGSIERAGALQAAPDCLLASSLVGRVGLDGARACIADCLARIDDEDEVTVALLECGSPSEADLDTLLRGVRDLRIERTEFVTLISCRASPARWRMSVSSSACEAGGH